MNKFLKITLALLTLIAASIFFLMPLEKQDWDNVGHNVNINTYPELVYQELLDAPEMELWLRNSETPKKYTVTLNQMPDSLFSLVRNGDKGEIQTVSLDKIHHQGDGIIYLTYQIKDNQHSYTKNLHITLIPDIHIIVTGGSATTTQLSLGYGIDYTETGYIGKLIPKWKSILWETKFLDDEVKNIDSILKNNIEDKHGTLLKFLDEN